MVIMYIKAMTSFSGKVSMCKGEVKDVQEDIADDLISCGYAKKTKPEKPDKDVNEGEDK